MFGQIRALTPFRVPGATTDHLIVGSDSGRIVILAWNKEFGRWKKVHQETYGKTGCRRIVPGQFLAAEPRGRACMIASMEKQKLVGPSACLPSVCFSGAVGIHLPRSPRTPRCTS